MKKIFPFIVSFFYLLQIHAQFVSDTIGCIPLFVKYKSPINAQDSIYWDFGDGTSSNLLNPSHVYSSAGSFKVSLFIKNKLIKSQDIKILGEAKLAYTVDNATGCAPLSIKFTNQSVIDPSLLGSSYFWDFGDGNSSSEVNPLHTYLDIGKYDVALSLESVIPGCNTTKIFKEAIKLDQKQEIDFRVDSISKSCDKERVAYFSFIGTPSSTAIYKWDFGNGVSSTLVQPAPVVYSQYGFYNVTLTVDNGAGCISSLTKKMYIPPSKLKFNINYVDTTCVKTSILVSNLTPNIGIYKWKFFDDASIDSIEGHQPGKIEFLSTGEKYIYVKLITSSGCIQDTTLKVIVQDAEVGILFTDSLSCDFPFKGNVKASSNGFATYIWNDKETNSSSYDFCFDQTFPKDEFYLHDTVKFELKLTAISSNGCKAEAKREFRVLKPNSLFSLDKNEGVVPSTIKLTDLSESYFRIIRWTVDWGDGTIEVFEDPKKIKAARHEYLKEGKYIVNMKIETEGGCQDENFSSCVNILKEFEPKLGQCSGGGEGADKYLCVDKFYTIITNEDIEKISTQFSHANAACEKNGTYIYSIPAGSYIDTFTLYYGDLEFKDPYLITLRGPLARLNYKINCDDKLKVKLYSNSDNYTRLRWDIDGESIEGVTNLTYEFKTYGEHKIKLYAFNDNEAICSEDTDEVIINLSNPSAAIKADHLFCENQKIPLKAIASGNLVGCNKGYTWTFGNVRSNVIVQDDSIAVILPPGRHKIKLQVNDENGCIDTTSLTVRVYGMKPDFTTSFARVCDSISLDLKDITSSDTTLVSWKWNKIPSPNQKEITYQYKKINAPFDTIKLALKDAFGCESSVTKYLPVIKIDFRPIIDSIICFQGNIIGRVSNLFPKVVKLNYEWTLGNTLLTKDSTFVKGSEGLTGLQKITVKGYDPITGCKTYKNLNLNILPKPIAVFQNYNDTLFCYPKTLKLDPSNTIASSLDKISYQWFFSNGKTSLKKDPVLTLGKGEHNIKLIVKSIYGCSDTTDTKVKLVGPEGNIEADKTDVCRGEHIKFTLKNQVDIGNYYWDFGQGVIKENINPISYSYNFLPPSGKTFATLVLKSKDDLCETVLNVPININLVEAKFDNLNSCQPEITFNNLSNKASSYLWKLENKDVSTDIKPTLKFPGTGKFKVSLIVTDSQKVCVDTFTRVVSIIEQPSLDIANTILLCGDETYTIDLNPKYKYEYSPKNLVKQEGNKILLSAVNPYIFYIKAISEEFCFTEKEMFVNYQNLQIVDFSDTIAHCGQPKSIGLDTLTKSKAAWSVVDGNLSIEDLSCINCVNTTMNTSEEGILLLKLTNNESCEEDRYSFTILNAKFEVPNVFSPNEDSNNDLFRPLVTPNILQDLIKIESLKIFNRWGKEIGNLTEPWDGKVNGLPATEEAYYFIMNFTFDKGCPQAKKGDITLIR